jgi:hypothetical protein
VSEILTIVLPALDHVIVVGSNVSDSVGFPGLFASTVKIVSSGSNDQLSSSLLSPSLPEPTSVHAIVVASNVARLVVQQSESRKVPFGKTIPDASPMVAQPAGGDTDFHESVFGL